MANQSGKTNVSRATVSDLRHLREITGQRRRRASSSPSRRLAAELLRARHGAPWRGGHKRMYRIIDFKRDKSTSGQGGEHRVMTRIARHGIALLQYADGEKRYILPPRPEGGGYGDLQRTPRTSSRANTMSSRDSLGTSSNNVELKAGKVGQLARGGWHRRAAHGQEDATPRSGCPPGKCVWSPRCKATSVRWAISTTRNITIRKGGTGSAGRADSQSGAGCNEPVEPPPRWR